MHHAGRGTVQNGAATLAFVEPPLPGVPIRYTATREGAITVELGRVGGGR